MTAVLAPSPRPAPRPVRGRAAGALAGTGGLVRLALRADRWTIGVWALAVAYLVRTSVVGFAALYPDAQARQARATLISSPAATALGGPGYGLDDYTTGAMTANELGLWIMLPVAIMAVLAVTRHLRGAEEDGRLELVRSQPVGRSAPVVAGLVAAAVATLVVGASTFALLLTTELDPAGSAVLCAAVVVAALVLASAAAVGAQLVGHARTANGLGMALIGVAFVLRAVGDVQAPESGSVWSWLSPFGWSQATAPYVLDRWWPLLLGLAAVAVNVAVAFTLVSRRDLGTGLLPERAGRARGRIAGLAALTWRRQRTSILAWGVATALCGALIGLLADAVVEFAASDPQVLRLFGGTDDVLDGAFAVYAVFLGVLAAAYAGTAVGAARADEASGRAAALLALPVSRTRWLGAQLAVAVAAVLVMLAAGGLLMGGSAAATLDEPDQVGRLLGAVLVTAPAALLVLGLAVLVLGAWPRGFAVVWAYVAYVGVMGMFAEVLPDGADALSPFRYLPRLPAESLDVAAVAAVTALAVGLGAAGLVAFRRRDTLA